MLSLANRTETHEACFEELQKSSARRFMRVERSSLRVVICMYTHLKKQARTYTTHTINAVVDYFTNKVPSKRGGRGSLGVLNMLLKGQDQKQQNLLVLNIIRALHIMLNTPKNCFILLKLLLAPYVFHNTPRLADSGGRGVVLKNFLRLIILLMR